MMKSHIHYHDHSWYDVGSQIAGKAYMPLNAAYYAMQIKEGNQLKFELRICRSALKNISCGLPEESVFKWLWYTSLVISQEIDDIIPFLIFIINANDLRDGKLTTPWNQLKVHYNKKRCRSIRIK